MPDLNEHTTPNKGWQFYQPETKWDFRSSRNLPPGSPTPMSVTLNQLVLLIIAMRKKNPAITAKFKLSTNPEAVKSEVLRFNRKRLGLPEEGTPAPFRDSHSRFANAGRAAVGGSTMQTLKEAAQGTAVGLEWLGSGGVPVSQELADRRAEICVSCPNHGPGEWYVQAPAEIIKQAIEAWRMFTGKKDFEFKTAQGEKLQSCGACHCLLTLKCFVPLEHIISKTKPEIMARFPSDHCWIPKKDA